MDLNTILDICFMSQENSESVAISKIVKKYSKNPAIGYLMNGEFIFHRNFCFGLNAIIKATLELV